MNNMWDVFSPEDLETSGSAPIIEAGTHKVKVSEIKDDESRNCTVVTFMNGKDSEIRDYFYATSAALWKLKAFGHAVGADKTKLISQWFNRRLIGTELMITVIDDVYEGKQRRKVSKYEPLPVVKTQSQPPSEPYPDNIPF